jgi:hypothetical protein
VGAACGKDVAPGRSRSACDPSRLVRARVGKEGGRGDTRRRADATCDLCFRVLRLSFSRARSVDTAPPFAARAALSRGTASIIATGLRAPRQIYREDDGHK